MGYVRRKTGIDLTGGSGRRAAERAAETQSQAAQQAIVQQQSALTQAQEVLSPYQQSGLDPLRVLSSSAGQPIYTGDLPQPRLLQFGQAAPAQAAVSQGMLPQEITGRRADLFTNPRARRAAERYNIGLVSRPGTGLITEDGQPSLEAQWEAVLNKSNAASRQALGIQTAPTLPNLPDISAPDVGPLPWMEPVAMFLPQVSPIQGALPGVQQTAPTEAPQLAMSQTTGLPAIPAPTATLAGGGPPLAPVTPSGLPAIGGDVTQDSLFQALKREAISGIESSAAARGKLFSGTTPQAIAERVQNIAMARAGDIQAQNIAARQQLMGEAQQQFGQQLATQQFGAGQGSQAFQQALAARQQLMGEQGQLFGESAAARQLGTAEAQQLFGQQMALRQLAGGEIGDIFGRSLAAQQQAAALQAQNFGQTLAARQALLAQQQQQQAANLAIRGQLIGERGQLFGQELAARQAMLGERIAEQERMFTQRFNLAQLGQAAAAGQAANIQAAAGNIGGLLTQQANALAAGQVGAANAQAQALQGWLGLGGALGGAAILASDRRVKTDIVRIGKMDNGLPLYSFKYKGKPGYNIGVMAQDVEKVKPDAVIEINGVKHVNYGAL